ncbi:Ankyrin repeat and Ankyrin repeat-containing domain-containing protein [Strongyloides ratti]|uniref:Ankyrin repeat and Ankyrin repeat-containing domain-containing protein n=1 Tax=Strongyloides ratti TaxID=34506 RepID=A0A090MMU2_STRRB|nr:Ankyrin repeat and Ankyrin repeat-containing domain-containing protein [Strongyloides ratti]CEF59346.1 Ankyrin repeat and Ankyrin repeat-containing domain-containing protein [Strongyloides ratti]
MAFVEAENNSKEDILLARKGPNISLNEKCNTIIKNTIDDISKELSGLSLKKDESKNSDQENKEILLSVKMKQMKSSPLSPKDFVKLQSMRSLTLAKKTISTFKPGKMSDTLINDLLSDDTTLNDKTPSISKEKKGDFNKNDDNLKEVKDNDNKKSNEESITTDSINEKELISRGPVRQQRNYSSPYHPYGSNLSSPTHQCGNITQGLLTTPNYVRNNQNYGNIDYNSHNGYYQMNYNSHLEYASSTPDSCISDNSFSSTSPYGNSSNEYKSNCNSNQGSPSGSVDNSEGPREAESEIPDYLSDFILKYSKRYSKMNYDDDDENCESLDNTKNSKSLQKNNQNIIDSSNEDIRASSIDSGVDSPLAARSVPNHSPDVPRASFTFHAIKAAGHNNFTLTIPSSRPHKEELRSLINDKDMDEAWAWLFQFLQESPSKFYQQDQDQDTLLHIVTFHLDYAKIFALVEQMIKYSTDDFKLYDVSNKFNETPLFIAIEKRALLIVNYLLEVNADPNIKNCRPERDAPLHFAAARGLNDIVIALCKSKLININMLNGMGLSPLMCAIKNHKAVDEDTGYIVDNRQVIKTLLDLGADPFVCDSTNGKTAIHYAVEYQSPEIIETIKECIDEEKMIALVNTPDYSNEKPMDFINIYHQIPQDTKKALYLVLLTCSATGS